MKITMQVTSVESTSYHRLLVSATDHGDQYVKYETRDDAQPRVGSWIAVTIEEVEMPG